MANRKFLFLLIFLNIIILETNAQLPNIPIGSWRSHFDYKKGITLTKAGDKIFMAADIGLFQYDITENEATIFNTSEGFHELNINKMAFDEANKQIIITYKSGAIDLVKLDNSYEIVDITSILSIKNSVTILESKKINDIIIYGNIAYLSADFGIVQIDLAKKQIKEINQNLSPDGSKCKIYSVGVINEKIYALSEKNLLESTISANLKDFNQWKFFEKPKETMDVFQQMIVVNNQIYIAFSLNGLYQYAGNKFNQLSVINNEINCLNYSESLIYIGTKNKILVYDLTNNTTNTLEDKLIQTPRQIFINNQKIWLADNATGLISNNSGNYQTYNPKEVAGLISTRNDSVVTDQTKIIFRKLGNGNGLEISNDKGKKKIFPIIPLNSIDNRFTSTTVNSIAVDKNNTIILATNGGIVALNSSEALFDAQNLNGFITTPTINGQRVLKDEIVLSVAIDGGNRKWVGTSTSLYLFNEELNEKIEIFTNVNSPLPSNSINFLNLEPISGEIFIYTPNGIVSYRTNSSEGTDIQGDNVMVFPNPVKPNFDGEVAISGLVQNATLKITDISGRLVFQTKANGGTASWNLNTSNGKRAESGVYYLFSSNEFGKESLVSKLAIIK